MNLVEYGETVVSRMYYTAQCDMIVTYVVNFLQIMTSSIMICIRTVCHSTALLVQRPNMCFLNEL